jgi:hypothetical protein
MYNISLIGIVTINSPLYNEYILIKIIKKKNQRSDLLWSSVIPYVYKERQHIRDKMWNWEKLF